MKMFLMEWNRDVLKFTNEMMGRVQDLTTWCMQVNTTKSKLIA